MYYYHNTLVRVAGGVPMKYGIANAPAVNFTGLNNVLDVGSKPINYDTETAKDASNFFDYNAYRISRSGIDLRAEWEKHGLFGIDPSYTKKGLYHYFLLNGVDKGVRIPNFNDNHKGKAPDIGALETGGDTLAIGPQPNTIVLKTGAVVDHKQSIHAPTTRLDLKYQVKGNQVFFAQLGSKPFVLAVFDIVGRKLWEFDGQLGMVPENSVEWNRGKTRNGIYFVTLEQGNRSITRKLFLEGV